MRGVVYSLVSFMGDSKCNIILPFSWDFFSGKLSVPLYSMNTCLTVVTLSKRLSQPYLGFQLGIFSFGSNARSLASVDSLQTFNDTSLI